MDKKDTYRTLLFDLILLTLGILGTMGCFLQMYPIAVSYSILCLLMIVTTSFYFVVFSRKRHRNTLLICSIVFYFLLAFLTYSKWKLGMLYILNAMLKVYEANSQYSFHTFSVNLPANHINAYLLPALWLLFTPMCAFLVRTLRGRHSYFLAFITSAPFLFSILLFTLTPHPIFFLMVLTFWCALLGMAYASRYDSHQVPSTITRLGVLFSISALLVMLGIQWMVPRDSYIRDHRIEDIRLSIQTSIRNKFLGEINTETGIMDLRSARNRMYIGSDELRVTMSEPQSLYLHGFSGTIYQDNTWQTPEINYFTRLYDYQRQSYLYPYNFVQRLKDTNALQVAEKTLTLSYVADAKQYLYTPYFAMGDYRKEYDVFLDAYIPLDQETQDSYTLRFADMREVQEADISELSENTFYKMMKDMNLEIPEELTSFFSQLQIPNLTQESDRLTKIQRIKEYMQSFGTYTLSPGDTPEDQDFVMYFLKENQEGYCVHYASAATMLLRYYGVPARYASGFRIQEGDFKNGSADIKDYHAHAWVELLDPSLGWVPLEVTPASSTSFSNQDENVTNPNPQPNEQPTTNPNQTNDPTNQTSPPTDTKKTTNTTAWSKWLMISLVVICVVSILPIRRIWIWKHRRKQMHQENEKQAILACGTYLDQLQIQELPKQIEDILSEAKFSNHKMEKEQGDILRAYCAQMRLNKRKEKTYIKRLVYTYIQCLD